MNEDPQLFQHIHSRLIFLKHMSVPNSSWLKILQKTHYLQENKKSFGMVCKFL